MIRTSRKVCPWREWTANMKGTARLICLQGMSLERMDGDLEVFPLRANG